MESVSKEEITSQLDRILASSQLLASNVLTAFLSFIVRETLEGKGNDLKEYTIAVCALKKDADFNPQIDSIVRIHAGRLRRALKEYYYENGRHDPITISIPKGSYIPTFTYRDVDMIVEDSDNPLGEILTFVDNNNDRGPFIKHDRPRTKQKVSIAVVPFRKIGHGLSLKYFVDGIGEYLSTELTSFADFNVIPYNADRLKGATVSDFRKTGAPLGAEYLVTGSIQSFEKLTRLYVQLNDVDSGHNIWAQTYECKNLEEKYGQFQVEVVERIMGSITGMNGAVSRHELKKDFKASLLEKETDEPLISWYWEYSEKFDIPTINNAKEFYLKVLKADPHNALAAAYLSEILSGESLLIPALAQASGELGLHYARVAITIDPFCQQGYLSLAISNLILERINDCIYALEKGSEVNPHSLDYRSAMGAMLIYTGEFERGVKILDKVITLNSHFPWWHVLSYSYYSYHREFYHDALFWAERVTADNFYVYLIKAAAYSQLEQYDDAAKMLNCVKAKYNFVDISKHGLRKMYKSEVLVDEILHGLNKLPSLLPSL